MVPAGTLSFGVGVYCACAAFCIALLMFRRYAGDFAELGGRKKPALITATLFVLMWCIYVLLSSLQVYGHISI